MMSVSLNSILFSTTVSTVSRLDLMTPPALLMSFGALCSDVSVPAHITQQTYKMLIAADQRTSAYSEHRIIFFPFEPDHVCSSL